MGRGANRLDAGGRALVRRLVAQDKSTVAIRRALARAGYPSDLSNELFSYYRRCPQLPNKRRKNTPLVEQIVCRELVLQGPDGKRGVLAVDEAGALVWMPQAGAAGTAQIVMGTDDNAGRGK